MQRTTDTYRSSVLPLTTCQPTQSEARLSRQNRESLFSGQTQSHHANSNESGAMINLMNRSDPSKVTIAEKKRIYKAALDQQLSVGTHTRVKSALPKQEADRSIVDTMDRLALQRQELVDCFD